MAPPLCLEAGRRETPGRSSPRSWDASSGCEGAGAHPRCRLQERGQDHWAFIVVALGTGSLRVCELLALTWEDIDLVVTGQGVVARTGRAAKERTDTPRALWPRVNGPDRSSGPVHCANDLGQLHLPALRLLAWPPAPRRAGPSRLPSPLGRCCPPSTSRDPRCAARDGDLDPLSSERIVDRDSGFMCLGKQVDYLRPEHLIQGKAHGKQPLTIRAKHTPLGRNEERQRPVLEEQIKE